MYSAFFGHWDPSAFGLFAGLHLLIEIRKLDGVYELLEALVRQEYQLKTCSIL